MPTYYMYTVKHGYAAAYHTSEIVGSMHSKSTYKPLQSPNILEKQVNLFKYEKKSASMDSAAITLELSYSDV